MAGLVQNSTLVLRLKFCTKLNFCASISATSPSPKPLALTLKARHDQHDRQKTNRNNANASQNKKSCNPTHKPTRITAHFILPNRIQRPTLLRFIRKQTMN